MSTNKGISVAGWGIYLILLLIVIKYVAEQYTATQQLEWIPLAFMAGLGVIGAIFQFAPGGKDSASGSGGTDIQPPTDSGGSGGDF